MKSLKTLAPVGGEGSDMLPTQNPAEPLILGINAYHGDVSEVLLRDGELNVAAENRLGEWF